MRKLTLALMALACLTAPASAQQQPALTADQGRPGTAPWPMTWGAGLAVNADLRIGGSAVAAGNPVPVQVTNQAATQPVTNSGAFPVQITSPGVALEATAQAGNASASAIAAATGTAADAATASGANTSVIGALRAIRDRILSTLSVSGTVTANQGAAGGTAWKVDGSGATQPVSAAALPLPAGAATAASQSSGNTSLASVDGKTPALGTQPKAASRSTTPAADLANIEPAGAAITGTSMPAGGTGITGWLSSIYQGIVGRQLYQVTYSANLAANGYLGDSAFVNLGASPSAYTYVNWAFYSAQNGTYTVQVANADNSIAFVVATGTYSAGQLVTGRSYAVPIATTGTRYRAFLQNGATASLNAFTSVALSAN